MTDQRTMRTFLDLVTERDEALGAATDLAEQAELTMLELRYAEFVHDVLRDCLRAADAERDEALGEATRLADLNGAPDAGHPEHSTPQEGTQ